MAGAAVAAEVGRLVGANRVLTSHHLPRPSSPLTASAVFSPLAACCVLPVALWLEPAAVSALQQLAVLQALGLAGALSALLTFSVSNLVGHTSGHALVSASVAKDVVLILCAVALYDTSITLGELAGFTIALWALGLHDVLRGGRREEGWVGLVWEASTNMRAGVIAAGMVALGVWAVKR